MSQNNTDFFNKISQLQELNRPFVVYRKPNESSLFLWIQRNEVVYTINDSEGQGFVFAPFDKNEEQIIFPLNKCERYAIKLENQAAIEIDTTSAIHLESTNLESQKEDHIALVEKAISTIKQGVTDKIVVSRKEIVSIQNLNLLATFLKILKNYPNAFVYLWNHPSVGCWMGASPERLINLKQGKFKTMALAGTQAFVNSLDVVWKHKEQEEQQFVTDYINEIIEESLTNISISNPYTVKAGSLLHLRTDISGELKDKAALDSLINALHPTPAVCGLPKAAALQFIYANEGYKRSFYSGYLGELNVTNETNLFVNLRCMEVGSNEVAIYIGGGITKESDPESEWNETVAKAAVMKKIL